MTKPFYEADIQEDEIFPGKVYKCKSCKVVLCKPDVHKCSNRGRRKKPVEVDVDKHCGVLAKGRQCSNSLFCKAHTQQEKEAVEGRMHRLDVLIKLYNTNKKRKRETPKPDEFVRGEIDEEIMKICDFTPVVSKIYYDSLRAFEIKSVRQVFEHCTPDAVTRRKQ